MDTPPIKSGKIRYRKPDGKETVYVLDKERQRQRDLGQMKGLQEGTNDKSMGKVI